MSKAGRTTKKQGKKGSLVTSRIPSTKLLYDEPANVIVGIDSGQTGAFVAIDGNSGHVSDVLDMPIVFASNSKAKLVDGMAALSWLSLTRPKLIVLEMVAARPSRKFTTSSGEEVRGQGSSSTFQFGMSYGAVVALALSCPCPVELVTPGKWKTWMMLSGDKDHARTWARDLDPESKSFFMRKKDSGRADARAIAEYGRRFILHSRALTPKV